MRIWKDRGEPLLGGRYRAVEEIYRSGMNVVHLARRRSDGLYVIAKRPRDAKDCPSDAERLRREAVALTTLRHPRIVRALDGGFTDGVYTLILERLDGATLEDLAHDEGPLAVRRAVEIVAGVLEALDVVHRAGLVHRDVKAGNVMMTRRGPVLLDFGLVTLCARSGRRARRLTEPGRTVGTPTTMSPEQTRGLGGLDARADLYACGMILYELLTGSLPYDVPSGDAGAVLQAHIIDDPLPFERTAPDADLPPALRDAVLRALEKRPEDRFYDAAEMRVALLRAAA